MTARSNLNRRTTWSGALHARDSDITWCVPTTKTFIQITLQTVRNYQQLISGLMTASEVIIERLKAGDSLIPHGLFESAARGMALTVMNADNHQLTWGVLEASIDGLLDFFKSMGSWSWCDSEFDIYDGKSKVGKGKFSGPK